MPITGYTGGEEKSSPRKSEATPDLDCGIYASVESPFPYSAATSTHSTNFYQVIPNSHFWTDLNQLLTYLGSLQSSGNQWYRNAMGAEIEYILIGIDNTIKNGYKLKFLTENDSHISYLFITLEDMRIYVESIDYDLANDFIIDFIRTIEYTIKAGYNLTNAGYNLTNGLKMQRDNVYKRIDGERDYQDNTWVARRTLDGTPDEEKSVAEWINYIEFHVSKAKDKVYHLDTKEALAEIRKIAALAVRAMEIHGAPERVIQPKKSSCDGNCSCKK